MRRTFRLILAALTLAALGCHSKKFCRDDSASNYRDPCCEPAR